MKQNGTINFTETSFYIFFVFRSDNLTNFSLQNKFLITLNASNANAKQKFKEIMKNQSTTKD